MADPRPRTFYAVTGWQDYQQLKRDKPLPWFSVYGQMELNSEAVIGMTMVQRGEYFSILCLACATNNLIPMNPTASRLAHSSESIDFDYFIEAGIVHRVDSTGLPLVNQCLDTVQPMETQPIDDPEIEENTNKSPLVNHCPDTVQPLGVLQDTTRHNKTRQKDLDAGASGVLDSFKAAPDKEVDRLNRLIGAWNTMASSNGLPRVKDSKHKSLLAAKNSGKRFTHAIARLRDSEWCESASAALKIIPKCPFLLGQVTAYQLTFDSFVSKDMVSKIVDGNYIPKKPSKNGKASNVLTPQMRQDVEEMERIKREEYEQRQRASKANGRIGSVDSIENIVGSVMANLGAEP